MSLVALARRVEFHLKFRAFRESQILSPACLLWPTDSYAGLARAEGLSMSFVAWKILRKMPKPLLLAGLIFTLVAAARA